MNRTKIKNILRPLVESILREASGVDEDAIRELILYAENDRKMYDILHNTYVPALQKFIDKGTFREAGGIKLLQYYYTNYVRPGYKKEYGEDVRLNPASRAEFAKQILESLKDDEYITY